MFVWKCTLFWCILYVSISLQWKCVWNIFIWKLTGTSHKLDGSNTFSKCGHFFLVNKNKKLTIKTLDYIFLAVFLYQFQTWEFLIIIKKLLKNHQVWSVSNSFNWYKTCYWLVTENFGLKLHRTLVHFNLLWQSVMKVLHKILWSTNVTQFHDKL